MLEEFSKEERIRFGLNIIEAERKKKKMSKAQEKRFLERIERLKKEREEFLKKSEKF